MLTLLLASALGAVAPSPELSTLLSAYEQGQVGPAWRKAVALLARDGADPVEAESARVVRLFAELRMGRAKDAAASIVELRAHGPELGLYLDYLEVGVLAALRRCDEANQVASRLPAEAPFSPHAWSRLASCWIRAGRADEASAALDTLTAIAQADWQQSDALLLRGRLAESQGDPRTARDLYRQILIDFPVTLGGAAARDRLAELEERGVRVKPFAPEELLPRADAERSRFRPALARRTYREVLLKARSSNGRTWRQRAQLGLVELDVVEQRYDRALATLASVLASATDADVRSHALFLRGDVLSRRGRVAEALASFAESVERFPLGQYSGEAALFGARLAYSQRDLPTARRFAEALAARPELGVECTVITEDGAFGPAHDCEELRDQASWVLAWAARRAGDGSEVMDQWLAKIGADGAVAPSALYWRMRLAMERSDEKAAHAHAGSLAELAPTSFYALAARDLLCPPGTTCPATLGVPKADTTAPAMNRPTSKGTAMRAALELFDRGLVSEARRVLRAVPMTALDQEDRTVAAWIFAQLGDFYRAALVTRRAVTQPLAELKDPALLTLAFPRPFAQAVATAAAAYEVPQELLYAVIREESAFNAFAVSPRGARGLMQMIRPTAMRIAREMEAVGFHPGKLFTPEISVRFGAHYLAALLAEFDGDVAAVVASYHAGETNVRRWKARLGPLPSDEFIEEIPFASTRKYVRKVLASYGLYKVLYGTSGQPNLGLRYATAGAP